MSEISGQSLPRPRGVPPSAIRGIFEGIRASASRISNTHGLGLYPPEYNVKLHGPYYPWKWYGKADPLGDVKLQDVGNWIRRRNFHPTALWRECNRLTAVWKHRWFYPRRAGAAGLFQGLMITSIFFYIMTYKTQR